MHDKKSKLDCWWVQVKFIDSCDTSIRPDKSDCVIRAMTVTSTFGRKIGMYDYAKINTDWVWIGFEFLAYMHFIIYGFVFQIKSYHLKMVNACLLLIMQINIPLTSSVLLGFAFYSRTYQMTVPDELAPPGTMIYGRFICQHLYYPDIVLPDSLTIYYHSGLLPITLNSYSAAIMQASHNLT